MNNNDTHSESAQPKPPQPHKPQHSPKLRDVISSVAAAAIGVQSDKNRHHDFKARSIWPFLLGGAIFTLLFITILVLIAQLATST